MKPFAIRDGVLILPLNLAPAVARVAAQIITEQRRLGVGESPEMRELYDACSSASSASGTESVPHDDNTAVDTSGWIRTGDAARMVGVVDRTIRQAASTGRVRAVKKGRDWVYDTSHLLEVYG